MVKTQRRRTRWSVTGTVILVFLVVFGMLIFTGCDTVLGSDDDDDDTSDDPGQTADELMEIAVSDLEEVLAGINIDLFDPSVGVESVIPESDLRRIHGELEAVLEKDADHAVAHLGLALTTMATLAYEDSIEAAMTFMSTMMGTETESGTGSLQPLNIATNPPLAAQSIVTTLADPPAIPTEWDTIGEAQAELAGFLATVDDAMEHINTAVTNIGTDHIELTLDNTEYWFDRADILLYRIALRQIQLQLSFALVYDLRLFTADGEFAVTTTGTNPTTEQDLIDALVYSLRDDPNERFLSVRSGSPSLADLRTILIGMLDDGLAAYNTMDARQGDVSHYLIPFSEEQIPQEFYDELNLVLGDAGIDTETNPIDTPAKMVATAKDILNGTTKLTAPRFDGTQAYYTVDVGAFFDSQDGLRDWLPTTQLADAIEAETPPTELTFPDDTFDGVLTPGLHETDVQVLIDELNNL